MARTHALDFGGHQDLPNVFIPAAGAAAVPDLILSALRALPLDAPACQLAAEYQPQDVVLWI